MNIKEEIEKIKQDVAEVEKYIKGFNKKESKWWEPKIGEKYFSTFPN
jgi:hypothetical protein